MDVLKMHLALQRLDWWAVVNQVDDCSSVTGGVGFVSFRRYGSSLPLSISATTPVSNCITDSVTQTPMQHKFRKAAEGFDAIPLLRRLERTTFRKTLSKHQREHSCLVSCLVNLQSTIESMHATLTYKHSTRVSQLLLVGHA
jgi:hypothetical protein